MVGGTVFSVFSTLLVATPLLIALLVGLGVAITNWSRYPRVALLAAIGLALELLATLLGMGFSGSLPFLVSRGGLRASQLGLFAAGFGVLLQLLRAAAWVCIVVAVFSGRRGTPSAGEGD